MSTRPRYSFPKTGAEVTGALLLLCGCVCLAAEPAQEQTAAPWSGALDVSITLRQGNTDSTVAAARLKAVHKGYRRHLVIEGAYDYGEEAGSATADKGMLSWRIEWQPRNRLYPWLESRGEHDYFGGIDLRLTAATGAGARLLDAEGQRLSLRFGLAYVSEHALPPAVDSEALGLTTNFEWSAKPRPDNSLELKVEWQGESGPWRLASEFTVRHYLTRRLSMRLSISHAYDAEPPSGASKSDLAMLVALGITF